MAEQRVLLSISNMKKYFPLKKTKLFQQERLYVKANDGIDLNIYEGETFGLVGESGCGKSTLGRVLLQLHSQTDGRSMYYGRERNDLSPAYVAKMLKRLPSVLKTQKKLAQERDAINRQYAALTDERARWALEERRQEANKKADDLYVDIAKIIGGFIVCDNLEMVSKAFLAEYNASVAAFRCRQVLVEWNNAYDALMACQEDPDLAPAKKARSLRRASALKQKIDARTAKAEAMDKAVAKAQADIEALRRRHRDTPGFAENEALLDSGIDLSKLTSNEMRILRKDMQLIFQDPYSSLNPRMTVAQLIGEGLLAHDFFHKNSPEMQEYILKIMEQCGLAPYMMHRYPHQFSGGQRQRIGIARSLALNPKFVVCDEAVSALDVSIQSQILNLLMDLKEHAKLTYLFISHDLSVIKYISDRIGVMYLGNMVELAASKELFLEPMHPYTQALLGAIPTTDPDASKELVLIKGDIPSAIRPPKGCKFHTRCPYVMDICKQVTPEFLELRPNHFVACHLRKEEHA